MLVLDILSNLTTVGFRSIFGPKSLLLDPSAGVDSGGFEQCYHTALSSRDRFERVCGEVHEDEIDLSRLWDNLLAILTLRAALESHGAVQDQRRSRASQWVDESVVRLWWDRLRTAEPPQPVYRVNVAFVLNNNRGEIGTFSLRKLPYPGAGLIEEPDVALCALTGTFVGALHETAPSDGLYSWSLHLAEPELLASGSLDGTSCGGALEVGFRALKTRHAAFSDAVVIADRHFRSVAGERAKIEAACRHGLRRVVLSDRHSLADDDLNAFRRSGVTISVASCIREALDHLEEMDPHYVMPASVSEACDQFETASSDAYIITGPRRSGKKSALLRLVRAAARTGRRVLQINLLLYGREVHTPSRLFWRVNNALLESTGEPPQTESAWEANHRYPIEKCTLTLAAHLLRDGYPTVIAFEGLDQLLDSPAQLDFLIMLRNWYNDYRPRLVLILLATNPHSFDVRADTSPLNVGHQVWLDLSWEDCHRLRESYGLRIAEPDWSQLIEFTGSRPHLLRCALAELSRNPAATCADLLDKALQPGGPFATELFQLRNALEMAPAAKRLLDAFVRGSQQHDPKEFAPLVSLGILRPSDYYGEAFEFSCGLYRQFFQPRNQRAESAAL